MTVNRVSSHELEAAAMLCPDLECAKVEHFPDVAPFHPTVPKTQIHKRHSAHLRRRLKKDGPHRSGVPHHGRGGVLDHVDEPRQTVAVDL